MHDVVDFVIKQDKTGSTFTNLLTFSYKTTILQAASSSVSVDGPQSQCSPKERKIKNRRVCKYTNSELFTVFIQYVVPLGKLKINHK